MCPFQCLLGGSTAEAWAAEEQEGKGTRDEEAKGRGLNVMIVQQKAAASRTGEMLKYSSRSSFSGVLLVLPESVEFRNWRGPLVGSRPPPPLKQLCGGGGANGRLQGKRGREKDERENIKKPRQRQNKSRQVQARGGAEGREDGREARSNAGASGGG